MLVYPKSPASPADGARVLNSNPLTQSSQHTQSLQRTSAQPQPGARTHIYIEMALDKSDAKKNAKANAKAAKNASAPETKENGAPVPAKSTDGECDVGWVQCDRAIR